MTSTVRTTMRQELADRLVMAWATTINGIGRRSPVVITTHERQKAAERNAFEWGRHAERYLPRPPEETPPRRKRHLTLI